MEHLFKAGDPKPVNSGRKVGSENRITRELKEMIREALDEAGGVEYLLEQAKNNPNAFMTLLGKIIPVDVKAKLTTDARLVVMINNGNNVIEHNQVIENGHTITLTPEAISSVPVESN